MGHDYRVATVREKSLKTDFFQVREKSGNFTASQGNLEKIRKSQGIQKFPFKWYSPGAYVVPVNMNVNFWQHA